MLKPKGQTSNWYMGLGFIFGHFNEHFSFILFYFPLLSVYLLTCCSCSPLLMCCAAQGLLTPSKRDCQSWSPSVVSAVCSSRQYVFFNLCHYSNTLASAVGCFELFFEASQHNGYFQSKGVELIGLTSCSKSYSAGLLETRMMWLLD